MRLHLHSLAGERSAPLPPFHPQLLLRLVSRGSEAIPVVALTIVLFHLMGEHMDDLLRLIDASHDMIVLLRMPREPV